MDADERRMAVRVGDRLSDQRRDSSLMREEETIEGAKPRDEVCERFRELA